MGEKESGILEGKVKRGKMAAKTERKGGKNGKNERRGKAIRESIDVILETSEQEGE